MADTYWLKQKTDEPLFADLIWSRPETKQQAGKLLIVGGNQYGFAAPAEAYGAATNAGIGSTRVMLPLSIKKVAGKLLPGLEFAANTPSGSFSQSALGEFLEQAAWADGVLFAGDLGRNSETAILIESFLTKHAGQTTITKDAADYCLAIPKIILNRKDTLLVLDMSQLQKLGTAGHHTTAFKLGMDLIHLVEGLHDFTSKYPVNILVKHHTKMVVAVNGQVSTTNLETDLPIWQVSTATHASVWWLQNPTKPFEALCTSVGKFIRE